MQHTWSASTCLYCFQFPQLDGLGLDVVTNLLEDAATETQHAKRSTLAMKDRKVTIRGPRLHLIIETHHGCAS